MGLGANLPSTYIDICEAGVQLETTADLKQGEEVEIVFEGHGVRERLRRIGSVRWAIPLESGGCRAGILFSKMLTYREVLNFSMP
jgi:hypothetical protein